MALSLLVIALAFVVIAFAVAVIARQAVEEMRQLSKMVDGLRGDLGPALKLVQSFAGQGEKLVEAVSGETQEIVRASRALRTGLERRFENLQVVYDVLAEEVEETAVEAAVTLRSLRGGIGWFGMIRRLLRLGRRR
jgi:predicted PurR-regulated permease PerM